MILVYVSGEISESVLRHILNMTNVIIVGGLFTGKRFLYYNKIKIEKGEARQGSI